MPYNIKFSTKDFFSKCDQIRNNVTFTEEILNGKLYFLCSVKSKMDVKHASSL